MEEKYMWLWISYLKSMEITKLRELLDYYEEPINIFKDNQEEYKKILTEREYKVINKSRNLDALIKEYHKLQEKEITFIHCKEENYPKRLKNIPDYPYGIFVKGRLPQENAVNIAIIGARNSTFYGQELARMFGRELAKNGVNIISGLALGIDGCSHKGALEGKGYTLGVLGGGIDTVYPQENYRLYEDMKIHGGILSEYFPGFKPKGRWFPMRNRIISGLSDGILVIEAKHKSGSLITVDQGLEQGKNIYAIPGRITDVLSEGCNDIIRQGATLVSSPQQILEEFSFLINQENLSPPKYKSQQEKEKILANEEKIVYSCLSLEPKYIDIIVKESKMSISNTINLLYGLEMKGYVKQINSNYYMIVV